MEVWKCTGALAPKLFKRHVPVSASRTLQRFGPQGTPEGQAVASAPTAALDKNLMALVAGLPKLAAYPLRVSSSAVPKRVNRASGANPAQATALSLVGGANWKTIVPNSSCWHQICTSHLPPKDVSEDAHS